MFRFFILSSLVLFLSCAGFAQYYVSNSGSDANPGTSSLPFKTIQKAADVMLAGDTCIIYAGIYHENVMPANNGTSAAHIVFKNYMNDKVFVMGTDAVTNWQAYQNGIYKAYVPDTVSQLMAEKKIANKARYPNFQGNFMRLADWKPVTIDTNSRASFPGMNFPAGYWVGGIVEVLVASKWIAHNGLISASSGNQVTCSATSYPWGTHPAYSPTIYTGSGYGYITHHLNALDTINEWHWQNDTLYYYPPDTAILNTGSVQARTRMYGFNCYGKENIDICNLHFVCATVNFETATSCTLDGGSVWYPSAFHFFMKGWGRQSYEPNNYGIGQWDGKGVAMSGYYNTIKNCYIAHSWGDGISVGGQYNTIENCLIEDCNYTATDCGLITTVGFGHVVTRNTIRKAARSALVNRKSQATNITYNDMYDCGIMTQDLGVTYTFQSNGAGSHISYNWAHDNHSLGHAMGIYLDNSDTAYNVHHNVIWNCKNAIQTNLTAKDHQIYNNTVWYCTKAMASYGGPGTSVINQRVKNNLSDKLWNIGNIFSNNLVTAASPFTNAAAYDFTLKPNAPAIDYGVHIPGFTDGFSGSSPDAGAYEYGIPQWIPGTDIMMPDISEIIYDASLPDSAEIISGTFEVCMGQQNVVYTVEPVMNATSYIWTLPNGASGNMYKNKIFVNFDNTASTGLISVRGVNNNGQGLYAASRTITVRSLPDTAGNISGPDMICAGSESVTYDVSAIPDAISYNWTLPAGVTGNSTTNSITVNYLPSAVSGIITVSGNNICGDGAASQLSITLIPAAPAPTLSLFNDTIFSSATAGNQWYNLATGIIPGAGLSYYVPNQSGYYYVINHLTGCPSDTSNIIYYNFIGMDEMTVDQGIKVIPNPNPGSFKVVSSAQIESLEVMDSSGRVILKKDGGFQTTIPLNLDVEKGNYLLKVITTGNAAVLKFIVD